MPLFSSTSDKMLISIEFQVGPPLRSSKHRSGAEHPWADILKADSRSVLAETRRKRGKLARRNHVRKLASPMHSCFRWWSLANCPERPFHPQIADVLIWEARALGKQLS